MMMARIKGTRFQDDLHGTPFDDLIRGRGAFDMIFGGVGNDRLYGDLGDDYIVGGLGDDDSRGGKGDDSISDSEGWNLLLGGVGDDGLGGRGILIGGKGDDSIDVWSGSAYGDEWGAVANPIAGNDRMSTDFGNHPWFWRSMYGGGGSDNFDIMMRANDGIGTRADVLDFTYGEDTTRVYGAFGDDVIALTVLDTNHDGVFDGKDPWAAIGQTWYDPNANAVCLRLFGNDGAPGTLDDDMVAFWGTSRVDADWL
jgi:hypothetical protein